MECTKAWWMSQDMGHNRMSWCGAVWCQLLVYSSRRWFLFLTPAIVIRGEERSNAMSK